MNRRPQPRLLCTAAFVLLALAAPGPSWAQSGTDSAQGTGVSDVNQTFSFTAQSGPNGENPSGQVIPALSGDPRVGTSYSVTCLNVQGNFAIIVGAAVGPAS